MRPIHLALPLLLSFPGLAAQRPDTSVGAVTAAAGAYLSEYQRQLTYLLADEHYTQRVLDRSGAETASRTMTGELFVTFLPADRAWMSVHDFARVDGEPIAGRQDLRALLQRDSVAGVARQLMARNARFNIGRTVRNFNEPTLGLLVLEPRRRSQFSFERTQVEREGDVDLVTLTFQERRGPTLVRSVDGGDLFSSGELTIEAGTGRIRRTLIRFPSGPVAAELTTVYAHEPKLDLWVPVRLLERYERTGRAGELTLGESTYTNWRRFEVDIRIR
jgi:hypothetical protein